MRMNGRTAVLGLALLAASATAAMAGFRPDRALRVATGLTAQTLCAQTFVSGQAPEAVFAETVAPTLGHRWLMAPLGYTVDRARREVRADWGGLFASRAVYRGAAGCLLWRSPEPVPAAPVLAAMTTGAAQIAGPEPVAGAPALAGALARGFAEPPGGPLRRVKAVVVVHDGRVVAEHYAPGVGVDTPLPAYSVSKTVTAALVGILVARGRLDLNAPAPVAAWRGAGDPRGAITLEQLLRMSSGLAAEETHSGFDFNSRMLFLAPDMAAYAASARLRRPPGTDWEYQSPNTVLAARIVADAVGGGEAGVLDFARRELFGPLGMRSVVMTTDGAGTPEGSAGVLASARDLARLGLLYLNDGVADGRRLLPAGWAAASARPTLNTPYGMGLWTNASTGDGRQAIITRAGMPADGYYASGRLGQRIYVIPSRRLVVVRMGATAEPGADLSGDMRLIGEVIAALPAG